MQAEDFYPAVLQCLSSGSTALEGAVNVLTECQMEERGKEVTGKDDVCSTFNTHSPLLTFLPFLGGRCKRSRN